MSRLIWTAVFYFVSVCLCFSFHINWILSNILFDHCWAELSYEIRQNPHVVPERNFISFLPYEFHNKTLFKCISILNRKADVICNWEKEAGYREKVFWKHLSEETKERVIARLCLPKRVERITRFWEKLPCKHNSCF